MRKLQEIENLYIYSLDKEQLTSVPLNLRTPFSLLASSSKAHLLIASGSCSNDELCDHDIEVYDVDKQAIIHKMPLDLRFGYSGESFCQMQWSPDEQYVAFISICDPTATYSPRELYLWNTKDNYVLRITDYTLSTIQQKQPRIPFASYRHFWLDAQTLLVGVIYFAPEGTKTETFSYNVQTRKTLLLSDASFQELAINPVNGIWAVRAVAGFETRSTPTSTQLLLGDATQGLHPAADMTTAEDVVCNLSWSSDGEVLASTLHRTQCSAPVEAIVFYDRTGQEISRHVPAGDPTQRQIIPIGWLAR